MAYTGQRLSARGPREIGLVNEAFDSHEAPLEHAVESAREIASKAPLAVAGGVMINYTRDRSIKDSLDYIAGWRAGMFSPALMQQA